MEILQRLITSDAGLQLVATLALAIWAGVRASDWWKSKVDDKFNRAIEILESAVEQIYREYVRGIKAGHEDGKLTDEEASKARELAKIAAIQLGKTKGVDIAATVGTEFLDLWIARSVKHLKGEQ